MDWEQIARTVAPTVAAGLFGPLGGIVANIVGGFLLPADADKSRLTPQDIATRIATLTDPKDLDKLRQADAELKKFEADNNFRFAQLEAAGVESARTMRVGSLASGNKTADQIAWLALISFLVVAGLVLVLVGLLLSNVVKLTSDNTNGWLAVSGLIGSLLGYFSANANQVVGFYFGSSSGSAVKSDQLAHQATQALSALTRPPPPSIVPPPPAPPPAPPPPPPDDDTQVPPGESQTKVAVERTVKATVTQTTAAGPNVVVDGPLPGMTARVPEPVGTTPAWDVEPLPDVEGRFDRALDFVFKAEGGFSNIPEDHGGATKFGITIGDLQRHRGHPVTVDDVRNMTQEEARDIYQAEYWQTVNAAFLPEALDLCAFDGSVLCGPGRSVRFLQEAMGFTGRDVDGVAGHDTIAAAQKGSQVDIVKRYATERRAFHRDIVTNDPTQGRFLQGWLNRVDALEQEALRIAG